MDCTSSVNSVELRSTLNAKGQTEDIFKQTFKFYRSQKDKDPSMIFDSYQVDMLSSSIEIQRINYNSNENCTISQPDLDERTTSNPKVADSSIIQSQSMSCQRTPFGLKQPWTWKMYKFKFPEGLVFIENPFTTEGQRYWISKCVFDYPKKPHITNIDNLAMQTGKLDAVDIDKEDQPNFYKKLRWITFGYHHNWDTKIYSEQSKCTFPHDLADLTKYISHVLGFGKFEAQAAIVNYYHLDSTLSGHQDRSERNQEAPLFSISFGQTALFLIGGDAKNIRPVPIYLRSGDIVVMTGKSRLSYHGVPRIIETSSCPWLSDSTPTDAKLRKDDDTEVPDAKRPRYDTASQSIDDLQKSCDKSGSQLMNSTEAIPEVQLVLNNWNDFLLDYISRCRINLNVRQVLFPGESSLTY